MERRDPSRRAVGAAWALVIVSAFLAACAGPASSPSPSSSPPPPIPTDAPAASPKASISVGLVSDFKDFGIVAYQGEALLGGREVRFSKVFEQGKPVVLNFWAGLCPPCRAEMPWFQKLAG